MIRSPRERLRAGLRVLAAAGALIGLGLTAPADVGATSVAEVSIDEGVAGSALIFEGTAIATASRPVGTAGSGLIGTFVTFDVRDVVKGAYPGRRITLMFLGGRSGDRVFEVEGMHAPRVGETGIYLVENPQARQVHPLYGWSQGHFRVYRDRAGVDRVETESRRPVIDVRPVGRARTGALSRGVARGVVPGNADNRAVEPGMPLTAFKRKLRAMRNAP